MSSPVETQVHPAASIGGKNSQVDGEEVTTNGPLEDRSQSSITNSKAWQNGSSRSLGPHNLNMNVSVSSFTGGFSSEDSDSDQENLITHPKRMSRSLGRKEVNNGISGSGKLNGNILPVSTRSAAYREMISSQNTWKTSAARHSALKLNDGSSTSSVQIRIKSNPFLQLDKQGVLQPPLSTDQRRKTLPTHLNTTITAKEKSPSHTVSSSVIKPVATGISVQKRIQIWAEKEKEAKAANRRSLQTMPLLEVKSEDETLGSNEKAEITSYSDNEGTKNAISGRQPHENQYEVIDDRQRIEEASSSSSEAPTPPRSKGKSKKRSPKLSKKSDSSPDLNKKRSKWKIKSPLNKHKFKKSKSKEEHLSNQELAQSQDTLNQETLNQETLNQETLNQKTLNQETLNQKTLNQETLNKETLNQETLNQETLNQETQQSKMSPRLTFNRKHVSKKRRLKSRNKDSISNSRDEDDVFSPVRLDTDVKTKEECGTLTTANLSGDLPSVFDKVETPPTLGNRSISREILSIIDSFGTIEQGKKSPTVNVINEDGLSSDSRKWIISSSVCNSMRWAYTMSYVRTYVCTYIYVCKHMCI